MSRQHMKPNSKKPIPKVALGYCHGAEVSAFWHTAVVGLLQAERKRITRTIALYSGPKIDEARNSIFRAWLDGNCDYLLMVDTDMVFPVDTLARLLRADKDIVGGLCFTGTPRLDKVAPTIHVINDQAGPGDMFMDIMWDYPQDQLVQCAGTGAACMLIKREVAEEILKARGENHPMPWFAHGMAGGMRIGEDIAFCLTAGKLGFEVWVDTGLVIGHVKPKFIGPEDYLISLNRESHPQHENRHLIEAYSLAVGDHVVEAEILDGNPSLVSH